MKLKLLDYDGNPFEYEIGELEKIKSIELEVISGDEVATIYYKDGTSAVYDTAPDRMMDFFDTSYTVYNEEGINLFNDEKWVNRLDSYYNLFS